MRYRLQTTFDNGIRGIAILENYRADSLNLEAKYQHFIAEVILLRLFSLLEQTIQDTALKLACQTSYRNGTNPVLNVVSTSLLDAENNFQNFNRISQKKLVWTHPTSIQKSVNKVLPNTEPFRISITNHGLIINEMRRVRNHIAHRASSTYTEYKVVVTQTFGAPLRIQTGAFLTSTTRLPRAKIDTYLATTRIIINDITIG